METLPVDLTAIVAIVFGMSAILIPIIGLTARFALKPIVQAMIMMRSNKSHDELLEKRVALLERQLEAVTAARMLPVSPITSVNEGTPMPSGTVAQLER